MNNISIEDFIKYADYVRKMSNIDPDFMTKRTFFVSDEVIEECKIIISEIDRINDLIKVCIVSKDRNELNRKKGKLLEDLAKKLMISSGIFAFKPNIRDHTNEIDVMLIPNDLNNSWHFLLPVYLQDDILIECKNFNQNITVDWVGKFFSLVTTHKVQLGIIFSYKEFAGSGEWTSAKGLSKKIFLAEKKALININFNDINRVLNKEFNIIELIKYKYNALRHHIDYQKLITKHPAEVPETTINS